MTAVLTTVGATLMATRFQQTMAVPITSVRVGSLAPAMRYDATPSPTGTRLQGLLDHTPRVLPTANITLLSDMGVVQIDVSDEDLTAVYDADEIAFMSGTTPVFLVAQASGPYYRKVANASALFSLNFEIAGMAATSVTVSVPSFVFATQAQAEAGTAGNVMMSPLRTRQAVAEFAPTVDYQVFTASGTWTKPAGVKTDSVVKVWGWGGGAAGSRGDEGGGGGYMEILVPASELPASVAVTVAAPMPGSTDARGGASLAGNSSTFGSYMLASGGGRTIGAGGYYGDRSGRGSRWNGGAFGVVGTDRATLNSRASVYSAGRGSTALGQPGETSRLAGDGGAYNGDGQAPGGGGGEGATRGGAGARGEIRVATFF